MTELIALWDTVGTETKVIMVLLALHPIASAITQWTDTPNDDTAYGWFYNKVVRPLALNKGLATQDMPKESKPTIVVEPKEKE